MTNHPKFTESHDSAARSTEESMASETRLNPQHRQECQLAYISEGEAHLADYACTCLVARWKAEELLWREREEELLRKLASYEAGAELLIEERARLLIGYFSEDGLSSDEWANPQPQSRAGAEPATSTVTDSENTNQRNRS